MEICTHTSIKKFNSAQRGTFTLIVVEVLDALPACVHLLLHSLFNDEAATAEWDSEDRCLPRRLSFPSLPLLSAGLQRSSICPWCRPVLRRPAGHPVSTSRATSTFSRPSPSPWSAQSTSTLSPILLLVPKSPCVRRTARLQPDFNTRGRNLIELE